MHSSIQVVNDTSIPASLKPLQALVESDLQSVNTLIMQMIDQEVPLIEQIARHIIHSGGKRMRPALVLASAKMCGHQAARHIHLAAAVEFLHTATLLHDDVVDESTLRRGGETANAIWSNQASVLVGDFLLSRAFQLMVQDGSLPILSLLSDTSAIISQGEVMQMMAAGNLETTEEDYLNIIRAKTAALFSAAAAIGPMMMERSAEECAAMAAYGRSLGIAFQLVDDALDYSASETELGKTIGDDFRECKLTLPVILAFQRGNAPEREFWKRCLGEGQQNSDDLAQALTLIEGHHCLQATLDAAYQHAETAISQLAIFPQSEAREALSQAAMFSVERRF
ncbi:MAG: polyprenyl synthetase family protein [Rickettsiales bacterium]|nr:polyprenyl synthetase family protein [Rickettsiales bacterium]